jgi:hypothetical protein
LILLAPLCGNCLHGLPFADKRDLNDVNVMSNLADISQRHAKDGSE